MPTPAYTELDSNAPDGTSGTGTTFSASALANDRALRDIGITFRAKGFVQTRTNGTGTADQPQFITWINSTLGIGFRWNMTWTGFDLTSIAYEWSNDSGATWTQMGSTQVNTVASNNVTASTNSGGGGTILQEIWGKCLKVVAGLATHIAAGVGAHGITVVATWATNAMAFTGGTGEALDIGQTTPGKLDAKRVRETIANSGSATVLAAGGTYTPDLTAAAYFKVQPDSTTSSTATIAAPSSPPSSSRTQTFTLEIVNGQRSADGKITWDAAYHWIGGNTTRPLDTSLEASGSNLFAFTWNGSTWDITHRGKRG